MHRIEDYLDRYGRREAVPSMRLAKRLRAILEDEEDLIEGEDDAKPVALFVYTGTDGLNVRHLTAESHLGEFLALIESDDYTFWNVTYLTGTPTVFVPQRESLLDGAIIVTRLDREHKRAFIVEPYEHEIETEDDAQTDTENDHQEPEATPQPSTPF